MKHLIINLVMFGVAVVSAGSFVRLVKDYLTEKEKVIYFWLAVFNLLLTIFILDFVVTRFMLDLGMFDR